MGFASQDTTSHMSIYNAGFYPKNNHTVLKSSVLHYLPKTWSVLQVHKAAEVN